MATSKFDPITSWCLIGLVEAGGQFRLTVSLKKVLTIPLLFAHPDYDCFRQP
jgi:hypothetical protein